MLYAWMKPLFISKIKCLLSSLAHSLICEIFSECQRASGRRIWGKGKVNKEKWLSLLLHCSYWWGQVRFARFLPLVFTVLPSSNVWDTFQTKLVWHGFHIFSLGTHVWRSAFMLSLLKVMNLCRLKYLVSEQNYYSG